jgi:hypothetical protein
LRHFKIFSKKIITPFTGTSTITNGISYYPSITTVNQAFIAGDRGCVPVLDSTVLTTSSVIGTQQTTSSQMKLGNQGTTTKVGVFNDWYSLLTNACYNYGTCCFTNLCNRTQKFSSSFFNLSLMMGSVLLIKFIF